MLKGTWIFKVRVMLYQITPIINSLFFLHHVKLNTQKILLTENKLKVRRNFFHIQKSRECTSLSASLWTWLQLHRASLGPCFFLICQNSLKKMIRIKFFPLNLHIIFSFCRQSHQSLLIQSSHTQFVKSRLTGLSRLAIYS